MVVPAMMEEPLPGGPIADEALSDDLPTVHEVVVEAEAAEPEPEVVAAPEPEVVAASEPEPEPEVVAAPEPSGDDDEIWESEPDTPRVRPAEPSEPGHLPERRVVVIDQHADPGSGSAPEPGVGAGWQGTGESGVGDTPSIGATLHDEDDGQKRRWRLFRKGGE
jgi:hypothetical protein